MKFSQMGQNGVNWHVLELAALQVHVMFSFVHFPFVPFSFSFYLMISFLLSECMHQLGRWSSTGCN